MQNFIEIHQRNPELLSSGRFRPPPRLDRGIERPRLDRVKFALDLWTTFTHLLLFKYIRFLLSRLLQSPTIYGLPSLSWWRPIWMRRPGAGSWSWGPGAPLCDGGGLF